MYKYTLCHYVILYISLQYSIACVLFLVQSGKRLRLSARWERTSAAECWLWEMPSSFRPGSVSRVPFRSLAESQNSTILEDLEATAHYCTILQHGRCSATSFNSSLAGSGGRSRSSKVSLHGPQSLFVFHAVCFYCYFAARQKE